MDCEFRIRIETLPCDKYAVQTCGSHAAGPLKIHKHGIHPAYKAEVDALVGQGLPPKKIRNMLKDGEPDAARRYLLPTPEKIKSVF